MLENQLSRSFCPVPAPIFDPFSAKYPNFCPHSSKFHISKQFNNFNTFGALVAGTLVFMRSTEFFCRFFGSSLEFSYIGRNRTFFRKSAIFFGTGFQSVTDLFSTPIHIYIRERALQIFFRRMFGISESCRIIVVSKDTAQRRPPRQRGERRPEHRHAGAGRGREPQTRVTKSPG